MDNLPSVPVPDDFEAGVFTRSMLASLPVAPIPEGFEKTVLRRAHSRGGINWSAFGVGVFLISLVVFVTFWVSAPEFVQVASVPNIAYGFVDLENLPPAAVVNNPDPRVPIESQQGRPAARKLIGVAGYPR